MVAPELCWLLYYPRLNTAPARITCRPAAGGGTHFRPLTPGSAHPMGVA
jgi:hypothetical protein